MWPIKNAVPLKPSPQFFETFGRPPPLSVFLMCYMGLSAL